MEKQLYNYIIYSDGRVKNIKTGKYLHPYLMMNGYYGIALINDKGIRKQYKLHKLLAMLFIPNPDNLLYVNHKDENKLNNSIDNLEWCTSLYNNTYGTRLIRAKKKQIISYRTGKRLYQIKDKKVINIYDSVNDAAKTLGIKALNITNVLHGRQKTSGGYNWKLL